MSGSEAAIIHYIDINLELQYTFTLQNSEPKVTNQKLDDFCWNKSEKKNCTKSQVYNENMPSSYNKLNMIFTLFLIQIFYHGKTKSLYSLYFVI